MEMGSPKALIIVHREKDDTQRWDLPQVNIPRVLATFCLYISHLFISPVAGLITSTLCNHSIHHRFRRGIALIAGSCHFVAYIIPSLQPPFQALQAAWNSSISGLCNSSELLGLFHGFYGTGATLAPALTTLAVTRRGWSWHRIYYLLADMAGIDVIFSLARTFQCLQNSVVLLCSIKPLSYVGCEVALGGWIVTFMCRIRHGGDFQPGMVSSGLWAGITVGRMVLGLVTGRAFKSSKWAVIFYLSAAVAMHFCFWLIPKLYGFRDFCRISGLGAYLSLCDSMAIQPAPRQDAGVSSGNLLCGQSLGCVHIPFMMGAIAPAKGLAVLQPIILTFLVLCFIIWCFVQNSPKLPWKELRVTNRD
ncbi:hypothetical protein BJX68DRAFT_252203 [Aspergillus pseudodeflectus]|uniref:Major facilitator superfamily domain-containing protein n=1 Tax=Aspergillus pseudodeflectus TaxID=176178 RepID=A0ABR4L3K2_9EURO